MSRSGERYAHKLTHEKHFRKHSHKRGASVGQFGIAVFRESYGAASLESLDSIADQLEANTALIRRSTETQYGYSVSILQKTETQNLGNSVISALPAQNTLDEIYEGVPSLTKRLAAIPRTMVLTGSSQNPLRSISIVFESETEQQLQSERNHVKKIIASLGGVSIENTGLRRQNLPHLSLGKVIILDDAQAHQIRGLMYDMRKLLPDTIELDRATFYNPARR